MLFWKDTDDFRALMDFPKKVSDLNILHNFEKTKCTDRKTGRDLQYH